MLGALSWYWYPTLALVAASFATMSWLSVHHRRVDLLLRSAGLLGILGVACYAMGLWEFIVNPLGSGSRWDAFLRAAPVFLLLSAVSFAGWTGRTVLRASAKNRAGKKLARC
jgi:hypothetical protein